MANLKETITSAMDSVKGFMPSYNINGLEFKPSETPTKEETSNKEETPNEEVPLEGLNPEQLKEAELLYKNLTDPSNARATVAFLMEKTGLSRSEVKEVVKEIKEEIKEKELSTKEILSKHLGEGFEFMSPQLSAALDELVAQKVRPLQTKLEEVDKLKTERANEKVQSDTNQQAVEAFENLSKLHYKGEAVPDEIQVEMNKIMDDMPPPPGINVQKYLNTVHAAAKGNLSLKTPAATTKETKTPAAKPSTGLHQLKGQIPVSETLPITREPGKKLSSRQAIEAAMQSMGDVDIEKLARH